MAPSEGTTGQRTVTPRMPESVAIRYVSNGGSDADDGLSWGTAKHTIYGALVSLPGGGTNTAGSGTVYVGPASSANPTANAGVWLMGPNDPNYSSPPTGWLKCPNNTCLPTIIGVATAPAGPNGHKAKAFIGAGSGADPNHPAIWLSNVSGVWISNLTANYPGRGVVIGECSNNSRAGTCPTTGVTFENDSFLLNQLPGNGPCTDITGASYWIWLRDYGCGGNAYKATGGRFANNAAAILIDGSTNTGNGLIHVTDTELAGGGIKVIPGINGGALYADNIIEEGDFIHDIPPPVWFTSFPIQTDCKLSNIQVADAGPSGTPTVQNDGTPPGCTVSNTLAGIIQGPAVVLNQDKHSLVNETSSPANQGQVGFFNGYMVGETDVARRIGGLTPARFANKVLSNPANWTVTNFSGISTLTPGQTDPFGGTQAASATSTSATGEVLYFASAGSGCNTSYTPVSGDWIVLGSWKKSTVVPPAGPSVSIQYCGFPAITFSSQYNNGAMILGDGQWSFVWTAYKVASGSATNIGAGMLFSSAGPLAAYGPMLYIIPAGTISDNEVLEFASSMNSVDSSCQAGQICNVAGHPLVVSSYRTLSNCSSVASPAKCDSAPAGSFVLGVGSTTARVNTTAVTANSQILIIEDSSLGAKLGVSCNKTTGRIYMITDRAPGLSFTVSSSLAPTDHPACLSFQLLN